MSKGPDTRSRLSGLGIDRVDPLFVYLVFAGAGLALWQVNFQARFTVLLLILLVALLVWSDREPFDTGYSLSALGRGALIGVIVSVPFLLFFHQTLAIFVSRLYSTANTLTLFQQSVLLAAPIESLFFRGVLQDRRGIPTAVGIYATAGIVYFAPRSPVLAVVIMMFAMAALAAVYGLVRQRYGLTASMACQAATSLLIFVCPLVTEQLIEMLTW